MSNGFSANHGMTTQRYNADQLLQNEVYSEYAKGSATTECPHCHTQWQVKALGIHAKLLRVDIVFKREGCPHCQRKDMYLPCKEMIESEVIWEYQDRTDTIEVLSIPKGFKQIKK